MNSSEYVKDLTQQSAVSGNETDLAEYLKGILKDKCGESYIDNMGNVIGVKRSANGFGSVMLEAHLDEIGLMIKSIDENGFLHFIPVGGIDPRILPGLIVTIHGKKDFTGVIGAKPPHVMDKDEYDSVLSFENLYIDAGMDKNEANEYISVGDVVTFKSDFINLKNNFASAKSLDDRAAVSVLLSVIDSIADVQLDYDLYICACVQEEVGMRGSSPAAVSVNPDFAIVIDVTFGQTHDDISGAFKCGCGPVVCKGPNIHPALYKSFTDCLRNHSIDYETEVEGGSTGTDAWAIQTSGEGIPTMLISVPLKYMHTPIETLSLDDLNKLCEAIALFLKSFHRTGDVLCI